MGKLCSLDNLRAESEGCEHVMPKIKQTAAFFCVFTVDHRQERSQYSVQSCLSGSFLILHVEICMGLTSHLLVTLVWKMYNYFCSW